ncbi:unnamed protein product [Brassica napus]|uniref:(rape) hypothetical protein n=1 Tax=Brassica napus TaxID=3708 RepID=A0A816YDN2_BRANA|nr:unnamed protein product [Brassica napus]
MSLVQLYPPTKGPKNTIVEAETEVVTEMVENRLMVVEVMVTKMELTKVIAQGKNAYGGVVRGGAVMEEVVLW